MSVENYENNVPDEVELKERKRITLFALPFSFTTYTLKRTKLIVKKGFFSTLEDEILLYRIMDVSLSRKFSQKLFGLATIKLVTSDKTSPSVDIKNIKRFRAFKNELDDRIAKERMRMRMRTNELVGTDNDEDGVPD